jgi:hypothetical protein
VFSSAFEDMVEFLRIVVFPDRPFDVMQLLIEIFSQVELAESLIQVSHLFQNLYKFIHLTTVFLSSAGQGKDLIILEQVFVD